MPSFLKHIKECHREWAIEKCQSSVNAIEKDGQANSLINLYKKVVHVCKEFLLGIHKLLMRQGMIDIVLLK